jgi:ribosome-associated translation inhibitor RaiA
MAFATAACVGHLSGRAADEWTHSYPLSAGGEIEIINTNGTIEFQPIDGTTVEVRAERIAKATTDDGARELLPRITISENTNAKHITIKTEGLGGLMIGANFEVRYHVKAPRTAAIRASNTNGQVSIRGMGGKIAAHTTNGAVTMDLDLIADKVEASTTNGAVTLTVPADAKADLSATVTNGAISVTGLKLETTEQSRRKIEGKINGGGPSVELHTTNGGVRVRAKGSASS